MTTPAAVAAAGQIAALRLMTDACRIYRVNYQASTGVDPGTGRDAYDQTELYAGPCRVRPLARPRYGEAGDSSIVKMGFLVSVPLSVVDVEANDLVQITSSVDGRAVGRLLKVFDVVAGTHVTARRLDCEETSG